MTSSPRTVDVRTMPAANPAVSRFSLDRIAPAVRAHLLPLVYANPLYGVLLNRRAPAELRGTPADPWPGDRDAGQVIVEGDLIVAGGRIRLSDDPWRRPPPGAMARAELHGFTWLRDLRALGSEAARRRAVGLTDGWLRAFDRWSALAWRPDVIGNRLSSWFANFGFLRSAADPELAARLLRSAARQARHLVRAVDDQPADHRRFAAIKGLLAAGVCLVGQDRALRAGIAALSRELARQLLPDGGHVQRNPAILARVLRDLIDIRNILITGHVEIPADLQGAIDRVAPMLRALRYGDGRLALFHDGMEDDEHLVQTTLALSGSRGRPPTNAPHSGYQRITAGRSLLLFDGGAPPLTGYNSLAHAGTLAFEMSVGKDRLIVNCGARPADDPQWHLAMRGTAAHSTLTIDEKNSAEVVAGGLRRGPAMVSCERREVEGNVLIEASHDGYADSLGLVHRRLLYVSGDGSDIRGEDVLARAPRAAARGGHAFAVRFHLHPGVRASLAAGGDSVILRLPSGDGWRFRATGGRPQLEDSVYLGAPGAPRRCQQIVVRGALNGDGATVKWRLGREAWDPKAASVGDLPEAS